MSDVLTGRSALITGASRGLGLEICHAYLAAGASVFICSRDTAELERARAELSSRIRDADRVGALVADVSDQRQVDALVKAATDRFPELSILVNNAGIYGPKGPIEKVDLQQWARALEVNLIGSVRMARTMIPQFERLGHGKVVQLSGGGATAPLPGLSAYAASKAAVIRFAETLAVELAERRIDVNAIAPGALNTRMLDEVLQAGPEQVGDAFYEKAIEQEQSGGTPLARGAELAVWLASPASDGITGKLLSAIWDPWRELAEHRDDLASDIYTLRRIVPGDRGHDWGEV
ncbi:MAG TPA: SDR family oxidoreductase [Solirubrobacteraceae bacterium]|nr:SDR family oxidoreductase [Solirubrobacteraceae bacterium]